MKPLHVLSALLLGLLCHSAAQDSSKKAPTGEAFKAAGEKLLVKLEEFATVLDSAKDTATAEAAKVKLTKLNKEIESLSKAAAAMGEPPPEIKAQLEGDEKSQARAEAFMNKWIAASRRIGTTPELLSVLQGTMRDFQRVSQPKKPAAPAEGESKGNKK